MKKNKRGIALILVVFLMLMCGLVAVTAFSLLAGGLENSGDVATSSQALSIALGGKEWYLEQLQNDNNWTDQANQSNVTLGTGTFDVTISTVTSSSVAFVITGKVTGLSGQTVRRQIRATARRFPPAARFALFWGRDTGSALSLRTGTLVTGDFWSAGSTSILNGVSVTGNSYCPLLQDITGAGTFTKIKISTPTPVMPQISTTYYDSFISTANSNITTYGTNTDATISANLNLTGGFYGYRTFGTTGNITISGNGYIVAQGDINLHSTVAAAGTLTITPSGGNIYFLSNQSVTVNSTANDTNVFINGDAGNRVYLYSRDSSTTRLVMVQKHSGTTTSLNYPVIIAQRRISVEGGAQLQNALLYLNDVTDTNNYLQITGAGTTVGTAGNPSRIISVSGRDPGLIITNSAAVTGFVYHYGGTTGRAQIGAGATMTGSVVASQFSSDRIASATITCDATAVSSAPNGFESFVSTDPVSWDDK